MWHRDMNWANAVGEMTPRNLLRVITQSWPTLCDPMNCSPPGSSSHGILQARILEWVAIPFSRGSSQPRDRTPVSHTAGRFFTVWATREACLKLSETFNLKQKKQKQYLWSTIKESTIKWGLPAFYIAWCLVLVTEWVNEWVDKLMEE